MVTGSVPVVPGLGDAWKTFAADVDPRLTSNDGEVLTPVPPYAEGRTPKVKGPFEEVA